MGSVRWFTTDFLKDLEWTNKVTPDRELDSTAKKVLKWSIIICTLGLVFLVTFTIDLSKKIFNKLFTKEKPPRAVDSPTPIISTSSTSSSPTEISPPVRATSQNILDFVKGIFNKENASKVLTSAFDGIKSLPKISINYLSNPNNASYNNIGFAVGITAPFWLAGGFVRGSVISLLLNGSGLAISKIHKRLMSPPENREVK